MTVWLAEIWRAWRASVRKPGFLLLAAGVLALGIGSTAAVFALIRGTLMQPLPYAQADRLVAIGMMTDDGSTVGSPELYQHLAGVHGLVSLGIGTSLAPSNVYVDGQPVQVPTILVDRHFLPTLGVRPYLGHNFTAAEDRRGGPPVVMLSYAFWQRFMGGKHDVVGKSLSVEGKPYTIVGVMPRGFRFFGDYGLVLPMRLAPGSRNSDSNQVIVGRLAPGASLASVSAQVSPRGHAVYDRPDMSPRARAYYARVTFEAMPLSVQKHADAHGVLMLFLGCALLVLLIALVNLGNLMLVRALSRSHDGAVRRALGASLWRQVVPSLGDAVLIGLVAGVAGVGLAELGLILLKHVLVDVAADVSSIGMSGSTVALAIVAAIVAALLAATLGVWRARRGDSVDELREGGRTGIGRANQRISRVLVVAQVVAATVLLSMTGYFLHTLYSATQVNAGFQAADVLTFDLAPLKATYPDSASVRRLSGQVLRRLQALPGVSAATVTTNLPVSATRLGQFTIGSIHAPGGATHDMQIRGVSPDYFKTFGIGLRKGRGFTDEDVAGSSQVAIVNRATADQLYAGHALGKTIIVGALKVQARIVGVVPDTRQFGPLTPAPMVLYRPLTQFNDHLLAAFRSFEPLRFALKVHGEPASFRQAARAAVAEVAPTQPIAHMRSLASIVRATTAEPHRDLLLIGVLAALALALASVGLYAVMAVAVATRQREIGVRMALGATSGRLLRWVLAGAAWQLAVGLVVGFALTLGAMHWARAVLTDLLGRAAAWDPTAWLAVAAVLAATGLVAALIPALRAGRIQPMQALRGE